MYKFLSTCVFILSSFTVALGQNFSYERQYDPVVLSGDELPSLQGKAVDSFFGYRFDAGTQSWVQVPFQVDERRWTDISVGGTKHPGFEYWYVSNEGNGFDSDDEIAFMVEDLGDMAPENSWPSNTDEERYEIEITDPLNGAVGYLYIFTSSSLSYSGGDLVSYSRTVTGNYSESTNVTSNYYAAHFSGNWVLDEIAIQNNPDLIDRLKFRVYALNGSEFHETEDYWSSGRSDYMGAVDGPVRAIRMVQGAASGPTTTYFMKFYRRSLRITYHYRVHGIPDLWYYMDYKSSISGDQYYATSSPSRWGQVSSDRGSLVISTDPSALAAYAESEATYYRNDPGFDDGTGEDSQAIQNHGLYFHKIEGLDNRNATPIYSNFYFLPANAANQGAAFHNVSLTDVDFTATLQEKQAGPDTEPPVVTITSSLADEYTIGSQVDISWQSTDNVGVAATQFEFIRDGIVEFTENWTGDPGSYSVTVEGPVSSNCQIRITCSDAAQNSGFAESEVFTIVEPPPDMEPPTIELLSQVPAELFLDENYQLNWQALDNVGVTRILVEILRHGVPETLADLSSGDSFDWTVLGPAGDGNVFRVTAFDAASNSASDETANFAISESSGIPANTLRVVYHFAERARAGWFWRGYDNVTIVDENDNPVDNATVSVTYNGPTSGSTSARTNSSGEADLVSRATWNLRSREWCFTISNVTKSGYTYRPEYNTAAITACTGEQEPNQPPVAVATATPNNQPAPLTVTFNGSGSSDPDGSIASYVWNFADGQQGAGVTVNHTYNTPGTYAVVLTVTDNDGATATATVNITVTTPPNQEPVAQASATPASGVIPLQVQFTGNTSYDPDGDITYHEWDFGDGSDKVASANPQHTYTSAGTFTATLMVIDDDGDSDTAEVTITANEPANQAPNAVASATPQSGPVPLQVTFSSNGSTDPDGSIVSYNWSFGDGGQSSAPNPQHTYAGSGQFQAVLTVTDDDGATDTAGITITVTNPANEAPNAVASANPQSGQAPLVVNFNGAGSSDSDGSIVGYSWNFGDGGQSNAQNPSHTYGAAGQYTVQLTVTDNDGASDTDQLTITVSEAPNQAPNAVASANPVSGSAPLTVVFNSSASSDPDGSIASRNWNFGDGSQSTAQNPSHTFNNPGQYNVVLTVTDNDGATDTDQVTITVNEPPNQAPTAVASANPLSGDAPLTVVFNSSASSDPDGVIASRSWNFGDGGQSTAQNPSHTFTNPGQYNVVLTVTDDDGATDTDQLAITVNEPPNQPPVAYIDTPQASGTFPVNQAINYSGHATDPEDGNLSGSTFQWSVILPNGRLYQLSSGSSSGIGVPVYTGTHELILSVEDSDGLEDEARITFNVTSGFGKSVSSNTMKQDAQIWGEVPSTTKLFYPYPNPFNPETTIQFELGKAERVELRIYNVVGLEVDHLIAGQLLGPGRYTLKWKAASRRGRSLPSGIYFVSLHAGDYFARHRLLYLK